MNSFIKIALAAAAFGVSAPAMAATSVSFGTTGSDALLWGSLTNSKTFQTTVGGTTYNVKATAWELDGSGVISQAHLGDYAGGLGATNGDEGFGLWNEHTIDNLHGVDFIALQFDRAVSLSSVSVTPFSLMNWMPLDVDLTYSYATSSTAWNSALSMNGQLVADLLAHAVSKSGPGSLHEGQATTVGLNSSASGNVWIIGADASGIDCDYDGFKLGSVTVAAQQPAVPEPATWATMLAGFGAIGTAMRRRSGRRVAQAV